MSDDQAQVLCIKWGTMYGPEYVNNLYGGVKRNSKRDVSFYCMTDDTTGISPEVECLPLPELGFEVPREARGKWPKQALWGADLFGLKGTALFIDLDSVIVDSIDGYFSYGQPDDVITAKNWTKPWTRGAQTSVFRYPIGSHPYLLENLQKDPQLCVKYQFEQNYLTHHLQRKIRFWPASWTKHYRRNCTGPWPVRYLRKPRIPEDCRIVTFPGHPNPPDAAIGRWNDQFEPMQPLQHFRWAMSQPTRKFKMLKYYVAAAPWILQHWKP